MLEDWNLFNGKEKVALVLILGAIMSAFILVTVFWVIPINKPQNEELREIVAEWRSEAEAWAEEHPDQKSIFEGITGEHVIIGLLVTIIALLSLIVIKVSGSHGNA